MISRITHDSELVIGSHLYYLFYKFKVESSSLDLFYYCVWMILCYILLEFKWTETVNTLAIPSFFFHLSKKKKNSYDWWMFRPTTIITFSFTNHHSLLF